ncbi:MAG: hypothetical protein QM784_23520 [Polyangiaceae bacterium]
MKSMFSVVLGVMALGLVAGCSDDSDSGSVSCDFVLGGHPHAVLGDIRDD